MCNNYGPRLGRKQTSRCDRDSLRGCSAIPLQHMGNFKAIGFSETVLHESFAVVGGPLICQCLAAKSAHTHTHTISLSIYIYIIHKADALRLQPRGLHMMADYEENLDLAMQATRNAACVVVLLSPGCLQSTIILSIICELMHMQSPPTIISVNIPGFEFSLSVIH